MNQDYLIFGAGYHGEVKSFEAGQVEVEVGVKAPEGTAGSASPGRGGLQQYVLPVTVIAVDGKRYNVATEGHPSEDEVKEAVNRWHPQPIQADELL